MRSTEWNLKDIYKTEDDFKKELENFVEIRDEVILNYDGKLKIEDFVKIIKYLGKLAMRLMAYTDLKYYENMHSLNNIYNCNNVYREYKIFKERIKEIIINNFDTIAFLCCNSDNKEMKDFKIFLDRICKEKYLIINESQDEKTAALATLYSTIINKNFSKIEFSKGENESANVITSVFDLNDRFLSSSDRSLRKSSFNAYYNVAKTQIKDISEIYVKILKEKNTNRKNKNKSVIDNYVENRPIYEKMIEEVNNNLDLHHRYFEICKKSNNFLNMYQYDIYAPVLARKEKKFYSYDEMKELILGATKPLGSEYQKIMYNALNSNWANMEDSENKYKINATFDYYGTHPYIIMDYKGNFDNLISGAHEFGHAVHFFFEENSQSILNYKGKSLISEVAATTNEYLLFNYMQSNSNNRIQKILLLDKEIKNITRSLFKQSMYFEFECWAHESVEKGMELTADDLCNYYDNLVKKYYGKTVKNTEFIKYNWSLVPHFFIKDEFYVRYYIASYIAATTIVNNIFNSKDGYVDKYISMLKVGRTMDEKSILKSVGVDFNTSKPIKIAMQYYKNKLDELERLLTIK